MPRLCGHRERPGGAACIQTWWWRQVKPHVAVVVGLCLVFPDDWLYAAGSDRPIHTHTSLVSLFCKYCCFFLCKGYKMLEFVIFPSVTAELNTMRQG